MSSKGGLIHAVAGNRVDEVNALLRQPGINVNVLNSGQQNALHFVDGHTDHRIVEVLLENGVNVNFKDGKDNTPLLLLLLYVKEWSGDAKGDIIGIVKLLLSQENIEPDVQNKSGETALRYAVAVGQYGIVRLLLNTRKVDIDRQDEQGFTALMIATEDKQEEIVRLLLQFGANRGLRDVYGRTAQAIALENARAGGQLDLKIKALFSEMPSTLAFDRSSPPVEGYRIPLKDDRVLEELMKLNWVTMSPSGPSTETFTAAELSFPPKDKLPPYTAIKLEHLRNREQSRSTSQDKENVGKKWLWIHVPSNNIMWVKWAIQRLPVAYKMASDRDGTNLIAVVDEALGEIKRSPRRSVCCTKAGDVLSIVMPYLATETKTALNLQPFRYENQGSIRPQPGTDEGLNDLVRLACDYGPQSDIYGLKNTAVLPETLDQSYLGTGRPKEAQDTDQVIYRHMKSHEAHDGIEPKILMVNQVWLWQVEDLVVTAFPKPWTPELPDILYQRLCNHCHKLKGESVEEFVRLVLRLSVLLPDEPGYGGLGCFETWETLFEKSITHDVGSVETERYRDFSEYIRGMSETKDKSRRDQPNGKAEREQSNDKAVRQESKDEARFKALYDIYPETEGLRQARDIRDELMMISRIFEQQKIVIDGWKRRTFEWRLRKRKERLGRLDEEARRKEERFNQLLDLKQKQGSLNFAQDADKRDRENEKQSQLLFAFTIITVIFTPLNFIAALFAIPTRAYPHNGDNVSWKLWQSCVAMLIAEILSVPTIWFWVRSTDMLSWFRGHGERESGEKGEAETDTKSEPQTSTNIDERHVEVRRSTKTAENSDTSRNNGSSGQSTKETDLEAQRMSEIRNTREIARVLEQQRDLQRLEN